MSLKITGVSAFGFGVNWEKTDGDEQVARSVVLHLEDRRVLFGERHLADPGHCVQSALEIRGFLGDQITQARPGKGLEASLRFMRAACRKFVDAGGPHGINFSQSGNDVDPLSIALGDLRTGIGMQLAIILSQYPQEIEDGLASILPAVEDSEDSDWMPGF